MAIRIMTGDCRDILKTLSADSVHCCVTSPPYWGLRDYGIAGQIGLEPTYQEFIEKMVAVFREVRRVLRSDGTLWLNLGDSYAGSGGGPKPSNVGGECNKVAYSPSIQTGHGLKAKDVCGIPWRVAFALQADGWWLRQDIIWSKPNAMPESVTDRCTKAHEYLFLLTKSARYYFDATAIAESSIHAGVVIDYTGNQKNNSVDPDLQRTRFKGRAITVTDTRNKRSVWEIAAQPFSEAHFATFPPALIEPCILAGTSANGCCAKCGALWVRMQERLGKNGRSITVPASARVAADDEGPIMGDNAFTSNELERGSFRAKSGLVSKKDCGWSPSCQCNASVVPCTVLDPFGGAGTTGLVADRLQRNAILIELNSAYSETARKRLAGDAPLFAEITDDARTAL